MIPLPPINVHIDKVNRSQYSDNTDDQQVGANIPYTDISNISDINKPNLLSNYDNHIMKMAYGGGIGDINNDTEYRLQKLERGQKIKRRGRVSVSVPNYKSQSFISQTSGNNPFVSTKVSGISYPPGSVPDVIAPPNNSDIRYPKSDLT